MYKLLFIFIGLFFVANKAHAFVFIEPYGGYIWGKSESILTAAPSTLIEQDIAGFGGGLRSGFYLGQSLFVAADATYFDYKVKSQDTTLKDENAKQLLLGAVAGFHMFGLRFWGGYYFKNEQEFEETVTTPYTETYMGTAWKAGVSFEFLFSLHLAFEYIENNFEKYKGNAGTQTLEQAGIDKLDVNTYFVSLTLPLGGPSGGKRR